VIPLRGFGLALVGRSAPAAMADVFLVGPVGVSEEA